MDKKNAEFENKKLAQIYESFNQFSEDEDFWFQRINEISPEHITDFGCGTGLFTIGLAEKGYHVTGIEPAASMLEIARNKTSNSNIEWILGNYKKLQGFKTDLILLTSHVAQFITEEKEWKLFLQNSYEVLNNGGYILFDSKNPLLQPWKKYTRQNFSTTKQTKFGEVNMQIESEEVKGNVISHTIFYNFKITGEKFESKNTLIYRTPEEIINDLEEIGFKIIQVYGDWEGDTFKPEHSEMIFLARKI